MDTREKTICTAPHHVIIQDRRILEMSGVMDVDSFDDTIVTAYTEMGNLTIHGRGLQIKQMNLEIGSLMLEGQIDSFAYDDVKKSGLFSRLLR